MRFLSAVLTALLLSAAPAHPQDIGAEYAAAYRAFSLMPEGGRGLDESAAAVAALIPTIEGAWAPASILSGDLPNLNADIVGRTCLQLHYDLVRTSRHGFSFDRVSVENGNRMSVRHDYRGMNIFQRSVTEDDYLKQFGIDPLSERAARLLVESGNFGRVYLFHPSDNILVMQTEAGVAEIYTRCP